MFIIHFLPWTLYIFVKVFFLLLGWILYAQFHHYQKQSWQLIHTTTNFTWKLPLAFRISNTIQYLVTHDDLSQKSCGPLICFRMSFTKFGLSLLQFVESRPSTDFRNSWHVDSKWDTNHTRVPIHESHTGSLDPSFLCEVIQFVSGFHLPSSWAGILNAQLL